MTCRLITGDCREVLPTLEAASVHCVVTSPPYYGLRDYGVDGQIGLEPTLDAYIETMVAVFREVRRVLRDDGTLWLNLGDSYAANRSYQVPDNKHRDVGNNSGMRVPDGLKPKDLMMAPARVALALQADGWYLRADIIWHKPNPMPESVTDRPTSAHEHIFLLTKSARYFYDAEAVREPLVKGAAGSSFTNGKTGVNGLGRVSLKERVDDPSGRNLRNVWTITTRGFAGAHFATFPPEIPRRCILAGTSAHGCCAACGAPWQRIVEKSGGLTGKGWTDHSADLTKGSSQVFRADGGDSPYRVETLGWQPSCSCDAGEPMPCTVLDPFGGAGTVGLMADRLGRDSILIELNPEYAVMTAARIRGDAPLFVALDEAERVSAD